MVPKINRELYTKLHPYYIRQDRKYIELQETLMAVTTAVSSIANLALEADKNSQMVDTKQIVTHALNATTLLGCAHQKLNNRRKESIAPALPKEIREVCSSQREVTSWLFGNDLAQAIKEAKEMNNSQMRLLRGKSIPNDSLRIPDLISLREVIKDLKITLGNQLNKTRVFNRAGNSVTGRSQNTLN